MRDKTVDTEDFHKLACPVTKYNSSIDIPGLVCTKELVCTGLSPRLELLHEARGTWEPEVSSKMPRVQER